MGFILFWKLSLPASPSLSHSLPAHLPLFPLQRSLPGSVNHALFSFHFEGIQIALLWLIFSLVEVATCGYLRRPEICGERAPGQRGRDTGEWQHVRCGNIRLRFRKCGRRLLKNLKRKTCRQRQRQRQK